MDRRERAARGDVESDFTDLRIAEAVEALRRGELVVVPTETVYGLACDGLSPWAIHKVYEVKGRPEAHPLILHVTGIEWFARLTLADEPTRRTAEKLAGAFWPGPLTLVLPKAEVVPEEATGGLSTVAIRSPNQATTLVLLEAFGGPLAAPSANRFTRLSPTRVEDLDPEIRAAAAMVLDAGPCAIGIESTVLDLVDEPTILRPGAISAEQLASVLGAMPRLRGGKTGRSPGSHPKHYSPTARVEIVTALAAGDPGLGFGEPTNPLQVRMARDSSTYAQDLYRALHSLDRLGVEFIRIEAPPQGPEWDAVRDRLERMAHPG